jgi:hypothetical protein
MEAIFRRSQGKYIDGELTGGGQGDSGGCGLSGRHSYHSRNEVWQVKLNAHSASTQKVRSAHASDPSMRSLLLPSFRRAFRRWLHTTIFATCGFREVSNHAAQLPSSKVPADFRDSPACQTNLQPRSRSLQTKCLLWTNLSSQKVMYRSII